MQVHLKYNIFFVVLSINNQEWYSYLYIQMDYHQEVLNGIYQGYYRVCYIL